MEDSSLTWLLNWFSQQCDGDWEHDTGIHIGTLDNPGWYLTVNIIETECDKKEFKKIVIERSENDCCIVLCEKENSKDGVVFSTCLRL